MGLLLSFIGYTLVRMILAFVGWLITVRKVSSSTISQYLSGLRMAHLKKGFFPPNLRPELVKSVIKGREHVDLKNKVPRLTMTIPVMRLLKKLITLSKKSLDQKRLLWVICSLAFHGSFRIHELLSRDECSYDPTTTLLGKDVRLVQTKVEGKTEEILIIHLKNPKEDKLLKGVNVELFATGTFSCPVEAWKKWQKASSVRTSPIKPVFCQGNGKCMTGSLFNKELKNLLGKYINYDEHRYLSHSFRAGLASMMAEAGYRDEVIMRQGRWHSEAFRVYCKTGRSSRLKEQRDLARNICNVTRT